MSQANRLLCGRYMRTQELLFKRLGMRWHLHCLKRGAFARLASGMPNRTRCHNTHCWLKVTTSPGYSGRIS